MYNEQLMKGSWTVLIHFKLVIKMCIVNNGNEMKELHMTDNNLGVLVVCRLQVNSTDVKPLPRNSFYEQDFVFVSLLSREILIVFRRVLN